jgi:hypothetical protein
MADGTQCIAEIAVSLGIIWPLAQVFSVACLCPRGTAEGKQCIAEVDVIVWLNTVQPDRSANVVECQVIASDLMDDYAQQMKSVGMGNLDGQNLAIRRFDLLEPAGSMVNKTALKQISRHSPDFPAVESPEALLWAYLVGASPGLLAQDTIQTALLPCWSSYSNNQL